MPRKVNGSSGKKGKTVAVKSLEKNPTPEEITPDHDGIMIEKVRKKAYETKYYTAFGCYKMYVKEKQKENNKQRSILMSHRGRNKAKIHSHHLAIEQLPIYKH